MKAHYVATSENQKSLNRTAPVTFHSKGFHVNTVTNTVQRRADGLRPGSADDSSGSSSTSDESDVESLDNVPGISDAARRVKAEERANFDSVDIKQQLDEVERKDLTSQGGYNAKTLVNDETDEEDPLGLQAAFPLVTPSEFIWSARRSNSERARRNRAENHR